MLIKLCVEGADRHQLLRYNADLMRGVYLTNTVKHLADSLDVQMVPQGDVPILHPHGLESDVVLKVNVDELLVVPPMLRDVL